MLSMSIQETSQKRSIETLDNVDMSKPQTQLTLNLTFFWGRALSRFEACSRAHWKTFMQSPRTLPVQREGIC